MFDMTPRAIVQELDKYIIGQDQAKRAVAVALRNRYRRSRLPKNMQDEVVPKNILMIGPTGVGKTEIARRLAKLVNAPFIKVEATKFTEVGYVGRDVDAMVRDLVETAIRIVKAERMAAVYSRATEAAEERLLELLAPLPKREQRARNPFEALFGGMANTERDGDDAEPGFEDRVRRARENRAEMRLRLEHGELENEMVEVDIEDNAPPMLDIMTGQGAEEMSVNMQDLLGGIIPKRSKHRRMKVADARKVLQQEEAQKLIDMDEVTGDAVKRAEESGIIFIDEIDKIAGREQSAGPDVSREGVQRDILPIVEGSTVVTKYGPVKTDHVLFIAAGAFHVSKPADLIPELQGRFPIRVELENLSRDDFRRILIEPENALIKQYTQLLATEGVELVFTEDGLDEIAEMAWHVNEGTENIGARRLHTILERLLEGVSYEAPETISGEVRIDRNYVREQLSALVKNQDLSRYIL